MKKPRRRIPPAIRFWRLVDMYQAAERRTACWFWRGAVAKDTGYGIFNGGDGAVTAHTFAFDLTRPGLDRTGLVVRHTCDNTLCVNPLHLVLGTHKANTADMDARGRRVNNPVRGEAHHAAKMEAWQVKEARSLYLYPELGWTIKKLAAKYGVSESAMTSIIKRRTWKHVK